MRRLVACVLGVTACERSFPLAGVVNEDNAGAVLLHSAVASGTAGDYYLKNEHVAAIVQKPGRTFNAGPYGGNLIDIGDATRRHDALGETIPFIQMGLTANFTRVRVVNDGTGDGPAVIEAEGEDELWDFINIQSLSPLLRYEGGGLLTFDPAKDQPLKIRARYSLGKDARQVEVRYSLRNTSDERIGVRVGFVVDMRGEVEPFAPGRGFTEPGVDLTDIAALLTAQVDSPYVAYQAQGYALGLRSVDVLDGPPLPRMSLGITGLAIFLLSARSILDVLGPESELRIPARGERTFGFDVRVARDVAQVAAWAHDGADFGEVSGEVREDGTGKALPGVRIAAIHPTTGDVELAMVTDNDGGFVGRLKARPYHLVADELSRPVDAGRLVDVVAGGRAQADITLGQSATLAVDVASANDIDDPALAYTPCRVALLGPAAPRNGGVCGVTATCDNAPFRHKKRWELEAPVPHAAHLVHCHTGMAPDAPLSVVPGKYLVVVSRGPEYDMIEELVEIAPGQTRTVSGALRRVIDSRGFMASDFHIHQILSPDSVVPNDERVRSFASVGIEFFATTDHDALTDLNPVIASLGLSGELVMVPGCEVSTHDLGHFNGFPLVPAPELQYGGPPDWGGGRHRPTPGELFVKMRLRGAEIVQVNHPRSGYFDSIGLLYDLENGVAFADPEVAPPNELMHMTPGLPLFSPTFDAMEIFNGKRLGDAEGVMRDWFNFLSMGFTPTGTAVSDSHDWFRHNPGEPRTYVATALDRPDLADPRELLANLKAGRAFGSSGPFLRLRVRTAASSAGFGELLTPAAGDLTVDVTAETADWYALSNVELFITQTYVDGDGDSQSLPLTPTRSVALAESEVLRGNGGRGRVFTAEITLTSAELGPQDGWLVVRVRGAGSSLYPVTFRDGGATFNVNGTTPLTFVTFVGGMEPYAFSNPVFLDRNGNGHYDPPYPMRMLP